MKKIAVALGLVTIVAATAFAEPAFRRIREFLTGFQEVPSVSTTANGRFSARINGETNQIDYSLSYEDLEGTVQQAHIHFGQKGVNGGIVVFLCSNLGNGPAGTQACPPPPARITGSITAADVSPDIPATEGARTQGINTGEFDELLRALRAGVTYVNVHSNRWPAGELRAQIDGHLEHEKDDR